MRSIELPYYMKREDVVVNFDVRLASALREKSSHDILRCSVSELGLIEMCWGDILH